MRKMLAALFLALSWSVAAAQAPGPVPALPDTERRTTYSISASICNCGVGFALFGDSTDYANWLTVWVNGVQIPQSGNWTIASPSGSLATLPRPITDAVLTFATAQTGTVQIVGARRPRRVSQFGNTVPARDLNQVVTDLVAQVRELWDRQTRTVQAPPGDTLNVLPPAATRANQFYGFDSSGAAALYPASPGSGGTVPVVANNETLANTSGISATPVGKSLSAWFDSAVCSNVGATVRRTLLGWACSSANEWRPQDYGALCDGSTDDHTALQAWVTAISGSARGGYIPAGPDCINNSSIAAASGTTITGAGREIAGIRGNALPHFLATAATNISLSHFHITGTRNVTSWASSSFGALALLGDGGTYNIQNMKFSGFNTNYWVYIGAGTSILQGITFSNNLISSVAADAPTDANNASNNSYGLVIFSGSGGSGPVYTPVIQNNRVEATGLCFPIMLFGNTYKAVVQNNYINNPGQSSPAHCSNGDLTTQNAYGIAIYDLWGDGNPPTNFNVSNNTIINPYASGIYIAGDNTSGHVLGGYNSSGSIISGNLIDGQTSSDDASLPRAGIAIGNATDLDIIGNKVRGGYGGIAAVSQTAGVINISGNSCTSGATASGQGPNCYRIAAGQNGSSNTSRHILKNNYGDLTSTASGDVIRLGSLTGQRFGDVEISGNTINAGWNGLQGSSQYVSGSFILKDNKFGGASNNSMANVSALTGTQAILTANIFDASGGGNGYGLIAQGSTIHMTGNKFANRVSGAVPMFRADAGTCGTIMGTQFNNVTQAAQVFAGSLGTSNPSGCTLGYLDFVQNLTPGEQGAGGSKYVVDHWSHISTTPSTTHLEQRMLTGN